MARMSLTLPPGFRFHPTDVELVMYYLKRKVTGKKLHFEAISEINIHNFAPWDLPDKACLKGHAPVGKRTDWIIHEYKILDEELAATGAQDNYVLCKVFKKNGLGPRNGSRVGALFDEADWASDDINIAQNHIISSQCNGPTFALVLPEKQSLSVEPGINDPGSTSAYCPLSSVGPSTSQVLVDEPDAELERLLAWLVDCNVNDTMLLLNDNGNLEQADLIGKGKNIVLPGFDGNDVNTSTNAQAHYTQINEAGIDFSV
ncbi:NAC domain-containing protein 54-like isoform X3 [Primulina eburnea]|uniref:NAC domain-containing protein 54-like isoform X3 n=1 Tax=Primulina eburnea TaxID=1245227 RepID=UPI003C6C9196